MNKRPKACKQPSKLNQEVSFRLVLALLRIRFTFRVTASGIFSKSFVVRGVRDKVLVNEVKLNQSHLNAGFCNFYNQICKIMVRC